MSTRLVAIDATRGIALLGMIAVHSLYESTANGSPTWTFAVFGGRAAAGFAVLAGVGIAFMTGRARVKRCDALPTASMLAVRALAVTAIGLALGYADASFGAVILPYYGVMFLLAVPLVFLPTPVVAALGAAIAVGMPALSHVWLAHLPVANLDNPTVSDLVHQPLTLLTELSVNGEYPALPWMAYLCAGIVVGRLSLRSVKVAAAMLTAGVTMAVGSSVVSSLLLTRFGGLTHIWTAMPGSILTSAETAEMLALGGDGTVPVSTWWWLAVDAPHTSTPVDLIGTTGTAIGVLGLLLLLGHLTGKWARRVLTAVLSPLAAAGSMTLTLYVAHIVFINSDYDQYDATTGYLLQLVAALLIGLAWRATAGRGPLEALVTALATRAKRLATRAPSPAAA
ncbi:heparan-alpha-glucosaminide N-acetyltransferase domain-containing protein [Amycolatopsis minnesotensis]|uniref:Heparan-alpha-glucosaminide N-acetyltransferase domain-containing protein n=1 Tax=Amycolatopsis minnesotensis TaxID=337894 RepID=A0ABN2Q964_9PSEU